MITQAGLYQTHEAVQSHKLFFQHWKESFLCIDSVQNCYDVYWNEKASSDIEKDFQKVKKDAQIPKVKDELIQFLYDECDELDMLTVAF